jgi:hypothetical protein
MRFIVLLLVGVLPLFAAGCDRAVALPQYSAAQIVVSGQGFPIDIAINQLTGTIYWGNQANGLLQSLPRGASSPTTLVNGLQDVQGVGVDAAGNVYYDEYRQFGVLYKLPAGSSTPEVLATNLDYPNFMSVDAAGDVYFITGQTCGNTIAEYNATTKTVSTILTAPVLDEVFIHPSGDLYFATCSNDQIERLAKGSMTPQVIYTWNGTKNAWYNFPSGIAVDAAGNVFFTIYAQSVDLLPAGGSTLTILASESQDGYGHQMALDKNDNVFFTDSAGGNIWEIPAETTPVSSYTPSTPTTSPLQMPQPPQPETSQSTSNTQQLVLALAVVAAVVIAVAFLYSRRKGQTVKKTEKVEPEAKATSQEAVVQTEKPTPPKKNFCIECGSELPLKSKFCNNCGTRQP